MPDSAAAYCGESLVRLKPGLRSGDVRIKTSKFIRQHYPNAIWFANFISERHILALSTIRADRLEASLKAQGNRNRHQIHDHQAEERQQNPRLVP